MPKKIERMREIWESAQPGLTRKGWTPAQRAALGDDIKQAIADGDEAALAEYAHTLECARVCARMRPDPIRGRA